MKTILILCVGLMLLSCKHPKELSEYKCLEYGTRLVSHCQQDFIQINPFGKTSTCTSKEEQYCKRGEYVNRPNPHCVNHPADCE